MQLVICQEVQVKHEFFITILSSKLINKGRGKFIELADKLEELKVKYENNYKTSLEFLKELIESAKEVLQREKEFASEESEVYTIKKTGKTALTELFNDVKTKNTHVIVERVVNDIDNIVTFVRFDGWQQTSKETREGMMALIGELAKYKLHTDKELVSKAYEYTEEYY